MIGGVALARSFGTPMPKWLFSWQMLLIVIGLFIGFRKGFRDGGWFVPILIGGAFLVNNYFLNGNLHRHMWPLILIIIGSFFIFRSGSKHNKWRDKLAEKKNTGTGPVTQAEIIAPISEDNYGQDDYISVTSIFGGTEKTILSKNFKGGNMVNIFGGSEISFTQADINGTAVLDVTCIFGGATLIVPSHWVVRSDAVTIFGGIGDKRKNIISMADSSGKALVIKGTILFGGLEIKSF
ncbi:MAG: LiaF domain-containing protein, partial [Chitinophagaceae bacterium]